MHTLCLLAVFQISVNWLVMSKISGKAITCQNLFLVQDSVWAGKDILRYLAVCCFVLFFFKTIFTFISKKVLDIWFWKILGGYCLLYQFNYNGVRGDLKFFSTLTISYLLKCRSIVRFSNLMLSAQFACQKTNNQQVDILITFIICEDI